MRDADASDPPPAKRDEETSPFPLERKSEIPPPPSIPPHGEVTGPFLLERERSTPGDVPAEAAPPIALTKSARRSRRWIAIALFVHTSVLAVMAMLSFVRWSKGVATPPELALAVLWTGVALVHLRAAGRFSRLGRKPSRDGHLLVGALSDLRTVIVLKAVSLFLALTLLCFSLSMVISLIASF